jgi:hypothetical protein
MSTAPWWCGIIIWRNIASPLGFMLIMPRMSAFIRFIWAAGRAGLVVILEQSAHLADLLGLAREDLLGVLPDVLIFSVGRASRAILSAA